MAYRSAVEIAAAALASERTARLYRPQEEADGDPPFRQGRDPVLREVEPAIFELRIPLEDGGVAVVRMSAFQLQALGAQIATVGA